MEENTSVVASTKTQAVKPEGKKNKPTTPAKDSKKEQQPKQQPRQARFVRSASDEAELASARKSLEDTMTPFFKQATINESNTLVEYVNAKMNAKTMEKRFGAAMAITPKSTHLQTIIEALPIIDSLMVHLSQLPASFAGKNADKFAKANENLLETATKLVSISDQLTQFVDMACSHNLVRSKTVMAKYTERKALKTEMRSYKIDPEASNALELLKSARSKAKSAAQAEEKEAKAKAKALEEEKLRLKEERIKQEDENKKSNELLMEQFGVTRSQLPALKRDLKTFEIDPASKDAASKLEAKRKETLALAQDDSKKESA